MRGAKMRTAFAVSSVILAMGGIVLLRAKPSLGTSTPTSITTTTAVGQNGASFHGNGVHGTLNLTHTRVTGGQHFFAELTMGADKTDNAIARAPASLAVVLDVSGSMSGEKLEQAKRAVITLIESMHSDDEISVTVYSDSAEVIQHETSVGSVRGSLVEKVRGLRVRGGTNIPSGLRAGLTELEGVSRGRVRRIVLASDGLDDSRTMADELAKRAFNEGITVSSLGIGVDFNESYMGGIASTGHGNFVFVNDERTLTTFLRRELDEASQTTAERATFNLRLPAGVTFVRAIGADARVLDGQLEVPMGALFAGDERRVVVELAADIGSRAAIEATASWDLVGKGSERASLSSISLLATNDREEAERSKDPIVFAGVTSVLASDRQIRATEAYAKGDVAVADGLIQQNVAELKEAMKGAPPSAAAPLQKQASSYESAAQSFGSMAPSSAGGKALAKKSRAMDQGNVGRKEAF